MKQKVIAFIRKIKLWFWIVLGLSVLCLLAIGILGIMLKTGSESLLDQTEAGRWSDKKDAAQISFFYSKDAQVTEFNIEEMRYNINKKLAENSIVPEHEDIRLYRDAFCGFSEAMLATEKKSVHVNVIAVSGDFFEFHPQNFVYGTGFTSGDIMDDYVILDEETAWYLYGSFNLVGQDLDFMGIPIIIRGVYHRDNSKLANLAGSKELTVYMPYSLLERTVGAPAIISYEIVMPNPVKDFAKNLLKDISTTEESKYVLMENSNRFTYGNYMELWKNRKSFSMKTNDVIYPFWENIARVREEQLMEAAVIQWVLMGIFGVTWFVLIIRFIILHKPTKETFVKLSDKIGMIFRKRKKDNQTINFNSVSEDAEGGKNEKVG